MKQEIIRIDLGNVNSYLIRSEQGDVLVDTGGHIVLDQTFENRRQRLIDALKANGCTKLNLIILTHGDNDHVCNAAYIKEAFHAPIAMHPADRTLVEHLTMDDMMASFHYRSLLLRMVMVVMKSKIRAVCAKTLQEFQTFSPDIELTEEFDLHPYGVDGTILCLPGHTYGSVGVLLSDGSLIAGDTFANNKKPEKAANALDFTKLDQSIHKLDHYNITAIYPGHGTPFQKLKAV